MNDTAARSTEWSTTTVVDGELTRAIDGVYSKHPVTPLSQPGDTVTFHSSRPADTRTFEQFFKLVKDSVDGQAKRKGYTENGADGDNALFKFTEEIGIAAGHAIGEIIYKLREYIHDPREVLLIKASGWCYLLWRYGKHSKKA